MQIAVVHFYMVSAGLDSMVLGEDQILGQIRDAMEFSMEHLKRVDSDDLKEYIKAMKKIFEI